MEDITFDVFRDDRSLNAELIRACEQGNLKLVRSILAQGADPEALFQDQFYPDGGGEPWFFAWSPLLVAVKTRNLELATLLLEFGVDPNFTSSNDVSPFLHAVNSAQEQMVILFLAAGAVPEALTVAEEPGHKQVLSRLNAARESKSPVYCLEIRQESSPLVRQALAFPGKAREHACDLAIAVRQRNLNQVRDLLSSGPLTGIKFFGWPQLSLSTLDWALHDQSMDVAEMLRSEARPGK